MKKIGISQMRIILAQFPPYDCGTKNVNILKSGGIKI